MLGPGDDPDWLFEQSQRIAQALAKGEIALAQIYGLRIPLRDLDGPALRRLAAVARLIKADFDPDEPRIPQGEPGAGEWTYGDDGDADEPGVAPTSASDNAGGGREGDGGGGGDDSTAETTSSGSSGTGEGAPPPDGRGDQSPPIESAPEIPAERPATPQARNSVVRRTAEWLRQAAALGAAFASDTRVRAVLSAIEATAWIVEYWPEIQSYLDAPKSLEELQDAVDEPRSGYQIHHIVEGQYQSDNAESNAQRFGRDLLESGDNLVLIPRWTHVEISAWYSTPNDEEYGGQSPRDYLRGKSWEEQYNLGIQKLRDFGVLE
jgi:hypothetical protein